MIRIHAILFSLVTVLTLAFSVLRSARNALAVADFGGSAAIVPYYELFGTLPASIILAWGLSRLLRRAPIEKVFYIVLCLFIVFFLTFSFIVYPLWRTHSPLWLQSESYLLCSLSYATIGLFFVVAELWKVGMISILLWGFVNNNFSFTNAKASYAPLMLGTSLGGSLAGPFIFYASTFTPEWLSNYAFDPWHAAFSFEMLLIALIGAISAVLFFLLENSLPRKGFVKHSSSVGLKDSLTTTAKTPLLYCLALIVLTDYLSYSLFEVIFLDALKTGYPSPLEYNSIMGYLSLWSGILTAAASLLGPLIIKRLSWTAAAIATPLSVVMLATPFLGMISLGYSSESALACGCICYCFCRATKYALLDSAKEMAYIPLEEIVRIKGKLAIEGIASRSGRAMASVMSLSLIGTFGGVSASAPASLGVFLVVSSAWLRSVVLAGREINILEKESTG